MFPYIFQHTNGKLPTADDQLQIMLNTLKNYSSLMESGAPNYQLAGIYPRQRSSGKDTHCFWAGRDE